MKRLIATVFMAIATSVFGSQQTQAAEARARHIREVQRARVERIKREIERASRANIYNQASAEASERNIKFLEERIKMSYFEKIDICNPTKAKKKPRNSLRSYDTRRENNRFERSAPARRRK